MIEIFLEYCTGYNIVDIAEASVEQEKKAYLHFEVSPEGTVILRLKKGGGDFRLEWLSNENWSV